MKLTEAINSRHSVRQFTDQPVDRDLIKKVVKLAQREFATMAGLLCDGQVIGAN